MSISALLVQLHAVGKTVLVFRSRSRIEKHPSVSDCALRAYLKRHPEGAVRVIVGDVERFLVGPKRECRLELRAFA
jgi:hypothetical protein